MGRGERAFRILTKMMAEAPTAEREQLHKRQRFALAYGASLGRVHRMARQS